jgi:hypothetical protein
MTACVLLCEYIAPKRIVMAKGQGQLPPKMQ